MKAKASERHLKNIEQIPRGHPKTLKRYPKDILKTPKRHPKDIQKNQNMEIGASTTSNSYFWWLSDAKQGFPYKMQIVSGIVFKGVFEPNFGCWFFLQHVNFNDLDFGEAPGAL